MVAAKVYNVNIALHIKRSKDEIEFANKESDRLHNLISNDKEVQWAKMRVEKLHEMMLLPNTDYIKDELQAKLKETDDEK